jgi:hypothetical protein
MNPPCVPSKNLGPITMGTFPMITCSRVLVQQLRWLFHLHNTLRFTQLSATFSCVAVPCTMSCSTLLRHLSSIAKAGSDAMATAHGDLLGWLGDLAPSGSLTSTELLYRTYGVSTFVEGLPVPSCLEPYRSGMFSSMSFWHISDMISPE